MVNFSFNATTYKHRLGRYVNDSPTPNSIIKCINISETDKHLCLFAKQNIEKYEEICYDYNAPDLWWRKKVLSYYCCLVKCGYCWSMEQKTNTVKWLWTKWTLVTLLLKIEQIDHWKCNFQGFKWSKMQIYQGNLAPGLMLEAIYLNFSATCIKTIYSVTAIYDPAQSCWDVCKARHNFPIKALRKIFKLCKINM